MEGPDADPSAFVTGLLGNRRRRASFLFTRSFISRRINHAVIRAPSATAKSVKASPKAITATPTTIHQNTAAILWR